jgi:predicted ATPase
MTQAKGQEALSWELRCALSLARLLYETATADAARDCLHPVYARFTEGFNTMDLEEAAAFLLELQRGRAATQTHLASGWEGRSAGQNRELG